MVAVKTKRQLHTKSNLSLACIATTDLVVGLVCQPLQIIRCIFMLKGETGRICSWIDKITVAVYSTCIIASLNNHLVVLSVERCLAINHSFTYESLVTEVRIMVASSVAWSECFDHSSFGRRLASKHANIYNICSCFYSVYLSCVSRLF